MNFQSFYKRLAVFAFISSGLFAGVAAAQSEKRTGASATPTLVVNKASGDRAVAMRNNLYCAGYVQVAPVNTENKIIGGYNEQDQFLYAQNNFVYINAGANKGVKVGDLMSVFRPRGEVKTKWTKKGDLGFYVQEVGALEVVRVKDDHSVARVRTSCDNLLLGDLVEPMTPRTSPMYSKRPELDLFADPNGKPVGRLFMARDNLELLARDQIVYVDLGAEDNIKVGDYLTIFREVGKGNPVDPMDEIADSGVDGFQSREYRGGKFSNMAPRKDGSRPKGDLVTVDKAKDGRPALRKVVGELVILNVKERTATGVITRTAQEIHTGDFVEVQ